jgi:DNA-directed RNA polymerase subunit L
MKFLTNFTLEHETLTFDVNNLSHAFLNAIRRLIISDVKTLGFRTEYGRDSDIMIHKNTSSLHNEFLSHRISLVPIHYDSKNIENFERDKFEFFIEVTNNTTKPMDITTEHIQIRDLSKEPSVILSKETCRKFFPPNRITGDYILLNRLKPNRGGSSQQGETLNITMKGDYSSGQEHSRYTPSCVSIFTNRRDEEKIKSELEKRIKEKETILQAQNKKSMSTEEKDEFIQSFMLSEADRYFLTDAEGEPNAFTFTIESDGRIEPHKIFDKSLFILEERINKFMEKIKSGKELEIRKSDTVMFSYDFIFENEDYTLCYLYQHYLYQFFQNVEDRKIKYSGCNVPHPLENKMVIRIALVDSSLNTDYIKGLFEQTSEEIKKYIHLLKNEMKAEKLFVLDR